LQEAIYQISDATSASGSMEDLYSAIHRALRSVMVADNFFIALYDKETGFLNFPYYVDAYDSKPASAPLGQGLTAYVIRSGLPLLGRPDAIQRLVEAGEVVSAGTRSIDWLGVPLKIRNETVGVMAVQTYQEGLRYSQRDLDILSFVSTQVALSIERKQTGEDLRSAEAQYRTLVEQLPVVIYVSPARNICATSYISPQINEFLGYTQEEWLTDPGIWSKTLHPEDRPRVLAKFEQADKSGEPPNIEYRMIAKNGTVVWISEQATLLYDAGGNPLLWQGLMVDISERKHREGELQALASVSAALRTAGSRSEILSTVLDQTLALLKGNGAALILVQAGTEILVTEAARGEWADAVGVQVPQDKSASRHVMKTGKPYVSNNLDDDSLVYRKDLLKGTRIFVSVPLSTPNGMVGALNIGRQFEFSNEEIRLLMNISDMAANAIQRASAYEQIQRQIERLKALRTIDMFIASGTDLHLTLQTILNQAAAQLEIDAADILLLNTSMHTLEFSEGIGFRTRGIEQTVLRVGEGYAGRAALERETVVIHNISENRGSFLRHHLFLGEGFFSYYGVPLIAKGEVKGVMEIYLRSNRGVDAEWMDFLESLSGQAALAIDNASLFDSLQRSNLELGMAYETTLEGWSAALDLRDKETEGHTLRVTELTLKLAESMGLSEMERVHIRRGALLHDIGKMGIPDRILLKPDSLTSEEWEIMRQHPTYAFNLLSPITHLRPALDIPYCHHERWDGSGYPRGMKGEAIPLAARIFAVVDVYDALCSDRPYRPAWRREKALEYIQSLSGVQFDPKVVEVFLRVVGEAGNSQ